MPSTGLDDPGAGNDRGGGSGTDQRIELPSRVAQWYYKHGLFLSSYPTCAASIAVVVVLMSCYPLLNIPLPGTIPTKVFLPNTMPLHTIGDELLHHQQQQQQPHVTAVDPARLFNFTFEPPFPWARNEPFVYIQQVVLRAQVIPWQQDMLITDAFRGPLQQIFKLLEIVRNHESELSKTTLANICLHVENVKRPNKVATFPEYNCLVLSPANFWQQNILQFNKDPNLLNTIFQYHNLHKSKVSTAEMLLGMQLRDTGIKRYPIRVRPRVIQYAITMVLRQNDQNFIRSLKEKLSTAYPLHQSLAAQTDDVPPSSYEAANTLPPASSSIMYIYYPGEFNILEFMPLFLAFCMLFIYVYFSVRKIDVIKSRLVLALCAVLTVLSSLMMSLGLCFFFGLTISLQSKGVFQYLVILVGLENVLVITKSVASTDHTFDVKIRLAQGLSKEGWAISKTLLTEITILTVGLATFVPVIQEFCIFAIVGLISDYFLQMMLFSTVLALDIKRVEFNGLSKSNGFDNPNSTTGRRTPFRNSTITSSMTINRSRSHPKLTALDMASPMLGEHTGPTGGDKKIPKRLRIVNFWARTRFFQRAFMLWMIVWIGSIVYNSRILEQVFVFDGSATAADAFEPVVVAAAVDTADTVRTNNESTDDTPMPADLPASKSRDSGLHLRHASKSFSTIADDSPAWLNATEQLNKLRHPVDYDTQFYLSNFHWSSILRQYNISMSGRYVTVLPAIKLSHAVPADVTVQMRNGEERASQHFQWKALAAALDPIDFTDLDSPLELPVTNTFGGSTPLYPKSPMEIMLAAVLCAISVFVLTYTMVVFYRCVCTKNYAEWRSSWQDTDSVLLPRQRILEGVPIQVRGHTHRIECMVTDGTVVASTCLEGQVKMWDTVNGELLATIDRNKYFQLNRKFCGAVVGKEVTADKANRPLSPPELGQFGVRTISGNVLTPKLLEKQWSPIWCLEYLDNLIVIGCADGRLEFWEASTGNLKCIYDSEPKHKHGITHLHLSGNRVVAARLSGRIDFLRLESYNQGRHIDWGFTSAYRRTHVRAGSTGSLLNQNASFAGGGGAGSSSINPKEELRCILELQHQGHQQPITCMDVVGGIVFTGSQDHTLKVFQLDTCKLLYTLHGHCGPITCLFIGHYQPDTGGSGSQDGLLCVWELLTGACMYSIQAHDGSIVSLVCAPSYVISVGADERLCVWERFQGHLLNTINISHIYTSLLMLTPSLLVTGKPGSLIVWDVRSGEPTREVKLDCENLQLCPKMLLPAAGSVLCDYGNELRIVRFPLVADKSE